MAATSPAIAPAPARRWIFTMVAASAISACSWTPKYRPARPEERLPLESFTVAVPAGAGWTVKRERDAGWISYVLAHSSDGSGWDRRIFLAEETRAQGAGAWENAARNRETQAEWAKFVAADLPSMVGDAHPVVTAVPAPVDPRFGPSAVQALATAVESDASAGLLVKRAAAEAVLQFTPPGAPDRLCTIVYAEVFGRTTTDAGRIAEDWRAVLAGVSLRPVDAEAVRDAARADFPKEFEPGLARRSLTLPRTGFQWSLWRERWIAPGGFDGSWGLAYGVTDRLELSTPVYLRYAFGDPAALAGPELAIGAGWTRYEHDAVDGSTWGGGASASARRRLGVNVAAFAGAGLEVTHASRTGENRLYGGASAGVVWDLSVGTWVDVVSLGLEAGWASHDEGQPSRHLAWLGGRRTPLVTVHLPLLDVGLTGGLGWDGEDLGALVGFETTVTF